MTAPFAPAGFDPYNPAHRAERFAWEEANCQRLCAAWAELPPMPPCCPLSVGGFDAQGNAKGSGWWL